MEEQPRWLSDDEQQTWRSFLLTSRHVHQALDCQLQRDSGMPHAYYMVLVTLSEAPQQRYSMTELSQLTMFSPSRLTHAMTKLERRGLAERWRPDNCGRTIMASLTAAGQNELTSAAPGHVEQVRKILSDRLSQEEQAQLRQLCDKILAAIDEE